MIFFPETFLSMSKVKENENKSSLQRVNIRQLWFCSPVQGFIKKKEVTRKWSLLVVINEKATIDIIHINIMKPEYYKIR